MHFPSLTSILATISLSTLAVMAAAINNTGDRGEAAMITMPIKRGISSWPCPAGQFRNTANDCQDIHEKPGTCDFLCSSYPAYDGTPPPWWPRNRNHPWPIKAYPAQHCKEDTLPVVGVNHPVTHNHNEQYPGADWNIPHKDGQERSFTGNVDKNKKKISMTSLGVKAGARNYVAALHVGPTTYYFKLDGYKSCEGDSKEIDPVRLTSVEIKQAWPFM